MRNSGGGGCNVLYIAILSFTEQKSVKFYQNIILKYIFKIRCCMDIVHNMAKYDGCTIEEYFLYYDDYNFANDDGE